MDGIALLTVLVLAGFAGYEVISKVSSTLHTPLMSGSNAISGIVLVGTVVVAGQATSPVLLAVALVAVALASINLVGGFVVTDRMLQMFRRPAAKAGGSGGSGSDGDGKEPAA
ncbi:MAG: NAD(P) transhydrogenase subunit alpha [Micromonosporaceae bacterium]|nr:NAD(P) transhydrogenase subunit alpha [Micromonosporaceae bacterium]